MNAQVTDIEASTEFATSTTPAAAPQHTDWSFVPTAAGGLTGIAIGLFLGSLLGLC